MITAPKSRWLKPLPRMLATPFSYIGDARRAVVGKVSENNTDDLLTLRAWGDKVLSVRSQTWV